MYSRDHVSLDPNDEEYWNEVLPFIAAKEDTPAFIEKIKSETGLQNITVIASSQGGQQMFYNLITNSSYFGSNVNLFVALAPLAKPSSLSVGMTSLVKFTASIAPLAHL